MAWLATCASAQADDTRLPADVIRFVGRRASCHEWSQKAIDPSQANQTDNILLALKCETIKGDERTLRDKYANNPGATAALNATWTKVVKRIPVQTPRPSQLDH